MKRYTDIYDYVRREEAVYKLPVQPIDGWDWNMPEHIKTAVYYKHGRLLTGNSDDKPVKNIVLPIIRLGYRAEDIDMKDVTLYVDDDERYHLSFLIKKYHDEVFVRENDLDTFFDDVKEEKNDFGGALVEKTSNARPAKVPLQSIAFCDQTDIESGPIGLKLFYSVDQLKDMESKGWGNTANGATGTINEVIEEAEQYKMQNKEGGRQSQTPGKYIEVYLVRGVLPLYFLEEEADENVYERQFHVVVFYADQAKHKDGITLFRAKQKESPFKFVSRDKIFGRALGFGGIEELIEPQAWTNYSEARKKDMIDAASKTLLITTDPALAAKHPKGLQDLENMELLEAAEGSTTQQLDTFPRNIKLFDQWEEGWEAHAQRTGSATDPLLGEEPTAGTPFKLQDLVTTEGKGIHEYRKEQYARFIEEIYQDWIIPHIAKKITEGQKFLAELDQDDLAYVADCLVRSVVNKENNELVLNGELPLRDEEKTEREEKVRQEFMRGGNKRFLEVLKGEFKDASLKVKVSVGGNKNLAIIAEKLSRVFQQIFATYNPQTGSFAIFDDPRMLKIFYKIIEYSGLDPVDFMSENAQKPKPPQLPPQPQPSPLQPKPPVATGVY